MLEKGIIKNSCQLKEIAEHHFSVGCLVPPLIRAELWEDGAVPEKLKPLLHSETVPALCFSWGRKYCRHKISIELVRIWSTIILVCKLLENKRAILKLSARKLLQCYNIFSNINFVKSEILRENSINPSGNKQ